MAECCSIYTPSIYNHKITYLILSLLITISALLVEGIFPSRLNQQYPTNIPIIPALSLSACTTLSHSLIYSYLDPPSTKKYNHQANFNAWNKKPSINPFSYNVSTYSPASIPAGQSSTLKNYNSNKSRRMCHICSQSIIHKRATPDKSICYIEPPGLSNRLKPPVVSRPNTHLILKPTEFKCESHKNNYFGVNSTPNSLGKSFITQFFSSPYPNAYSTGKISTLVNSSLNLSSAHQKSHRTSNFILPGLPTSPLKKVRSIYCSMCNGNKLLGQNYVFDGTTRDKNRNLSIMCAKLNCEDEKQDHELDKRGFFNRIRKLKFSMSIEKANKLKELIVHSKMIKEPHKVPSFLFRYTRVNLKRIFRIPLSPSTQAIITIQLYILHMLYLSKKTVLFPYQLIPNQYGLFQRMGLDTLTGFIALTLIPLLTRHSPIFAKTLYTSNSSDLKQFLRNSTQAQPLLMRSTKGKRILTVMTLLTSAYITSGYGALVCDWLLSVLAAFGVPINIAMHRSLQILFGHLAWVYMGSLILEQGLKPFFPPHGNWYILDYRQNWVWWVVFGYYVSNFFFTISDFFNQLLMSYIIQIEPTETVVTRMIQPENNDIAALLVGSLAPCVSAPWWEEVLYRGFTLSSLRMYTYEYIASPISSILFAAHHLTLYNFIPLTAIGYTWSQLYLRSNNLLVTVLIHAMWNTRIFLGSLLGV